MKTKTKTEKAKILKVKRMFFENRKKYLTKKGHITRPIPADYKVKIEGSNRWLRLKYFEYTYFVVTNSKRIYICIDEMFRVERNMRNNY